MEEKITSNECSVILDALRGYRDANDKSHEDIRELIHEGLRGIRLTMDANAETTNERLGTMVKRMDTNNGNVAALQKSSNERAEAVRDFRRLEAELSGFKRKWLYLIGGAVALVLAVVVIYDLVGLRGLIELIK
jgi:Flp pilus assembly protein TadB